MARSFNGTTDVIKTTFNYGNDGSGNVNAVSWSFWAYITGGTSAFGNSNATNGPELQTNAGGVLSLNKMGVAIIGVSTGTTSANAWHAIGITITKGASGATLKFYIDGALDSTQTTTTNLTTVTNMWIGGSGGSDAFYAGRIADFAIWTSVLTDAQMIALGKGSRPYQIGTPSQLWLPLDGLQSPEPDLSGSALNGTLTGTALAAGPPVMQFTPRWPQSPSSASTIIYGSSVFDIEW